MSFMRKMPSDGELFQLILTTEDEADAEALNPLERSFDVPQRVMKKLGYESYIIAGDGKLPVLQRIEAIHKSLYRIKDCAIGGLHGGAFMFRGIATWVYIPLMYGTVGIDPFNFCDLNDMQKRWLATRKSDYNAYINTFADIYDFAGGIGNLADYQIPPIESMPLLGLAAFHIQSSAATLCNAFDTRGCVQSAILASELALKAALKGAGRSENELKNHGHNLERLTDATAEAYSEFDAESVSSYIGMMPHYVENRYSSSQPTRYEAGSIVMASQHIAGATMRALTGGDFKRHIVMESDPA